MSELDIVLAAIKDNKQEIDADLDKLFKASTANTVAITEIVTREATIAAERARTECPEISSLRTEVGTKITKEVGGIKTHVARVSLVSFVAGGVAAFYAKAKGWLP